METQTKALAVVSVRLPSDLYEAVVARAKAEDRSIASVVRIALAKYVLAKYIGPWRPSVRAQ